MKRWILIGAVLLAAMIVLPTAIRDQQTSPASNREQLVTPPATTTDAVPATTRPSAKIAPATTVPGPVTRLRAGDFCKRAAEGQTVTGASGKGLTCTYDDGYRWVSS